MDQGDLSGADGSKVGDNEENVHNKQGLISIVFLSYTRNLTI